MPRSSFPKSLVWDCVHKLLLLDFISTWLYFTIVGKTYKSKVCVKKHLWEHSVYWDLFDGMKKQQRVLSIQAALILAIKFNPSLSILVVTQSSNNIKKNKTEKFENSEKSVTNTNKSSLQQTVINNNVFKDNIHPSRKRKIGDMVTEDKKQFKKYNQMISNCTVESSYINSDVPTVLPNQ